MFDVRENPYWVIMWSIYESLFSTCKICGYDDDEF